MKLSKKVTFSTGCNKARPKVQEEDDAHIRAEGHVKVVPSDID
jgi:hypothetical protein